MMGMLGLMWIVYRVYKSLCLWKVPMKHENTTATVPMSCILWKR